MSDRIHINAEDVATRLQISTPTLYRWVKKKKFPAGEHADRSGMPGPRTTTLWDIRTVDQWAIDNDVIIRIDPTLPDREYLGLVDDPTWVKHAHTALYVIGAAAIAYLLYSWII
jgi:hypothetical protein